MSFTGSLATGSFEICICDVIQIYPRCKYTCTQWRKIPGAGERVFVEKVLLLKAFATRERRNIESRHPLAGALPVHGVLGGSDKECIFFVVHFFFSSSMWSVNFSWYPDHFSLYFVFMREFFKAYISFNMNVTYEVTCNTEFFNKIDMFLIM